jgi:hypothetical protein
VHGSTTDVALIANAIDNGPDGLLDLVDGRRGFQQVLVITAGDKITAADLEGEILIEHTRPDVLSHHTLTRAGIGWTKT